MSIVDVDQVLCSPATTYTVCYNQRDLLLYAVGIGESSLQFTYEFHDAFAAFPLYPVCLPFKGQSQDVVPFPPEPIIAALPKGVPSLNPAMILHGEQSVEILRPLDPQGGTLTATTSVISCYDKGTGTLLETQTQLSDAKGPVATLISGSFLRGLTGYDGKGRERPARVQIPKRQPDFHDECKTSPYQAQIYRLSGDYNALHIDPELATSVGFQQPILHGLCSMGVASRETIETWMWQEGSGKVLFQAVAKERGVVIIDGGEFLFDANASSRL